MNPSDRSPPDPVRRRRTRFATTSGWLLLATACFAPATYRREADAQVYDIQETAFASVTGERKTIDVERPVDTLRRRLEQARTDQVVLSLSDALDVAAENSRDFQRQKETLYLAGLALTTVLRNFSFVFAAGDSATIDGVDDDAIDVSFRSDLQAAANTTSGGRIVASFVNNLLRSVLSGGGFDAGSILSLSFTQPLLRGGLVRVAREPLNQAERDVVYAVRGFERFRNTFAVRVVSQYYRVLQQMANLEIEEANVGTTKQNAERVQSFVEAERTRRIEAGRTSQQVFIAEDRLNNAQVQLQRQLDGFKQLLGLPTEANVTLDLGELDVLRETAIEPIELSSEDAVALALKRRLDYRTTIDEVADAGRRVLVAEDALESSFDLSAAIDIPTEGDRSFKFDWERLNWRAGFDLDLALDRIRERNGYRSSLISLNLAIRNREQDRDAIVAQIRDALRNIARALTSYRIQADSVRLAELRVDSTRELLLANRAQTIDVVDAQNDLLSARLALTGAIVDYVIARLELLRDLEGLVLEPKGLRYDPGLPLPTPESAGLPMAEGAPSAEAAADPKAEGKR